MKVCIIGGGLVSLTLANVLIKKEIFVDILIVFFLVLCLYIYYYYYCTTLFLYSVIFLVEIPLLIVLFLLINNPNKKTFSNISILIKYITICGILVLLLANIG